MMCAFVLCVCVCACVSIPSDKMYMSLLRTYRCASRYAHRQGLFAKIPPSMNAYLSVNEIECVREWAEKSVCACVRRTDKGFKNPSINERMRGVSEWEKYTNLPRQQGQRKLGRQLWHAQHPVFVWVCACVGIWVWCVSVCLYACMCFHVFYVDLCISL